METIFKNRVGEKEKRCLFGFFIMLIWFVPYLIFEPISSDTNDDLAMNLIAAGAFGDNSQFIVYSNVLYGFFLKGLFSIAPSVNWYFYTAIICNAFSAAILGASLAYFLDSRLLPLVLTALHFYFAGEFYQSIQFTKNAYLYAICGIVLLMMSSVISSYRKIVAFLGVFMMALAFVVRRECLLLMLPFLMVMLIRCYRRDKDYCIYIIKMLAGMMLFCVLAFAADQCLFWNRAEWKEYYDYHFNGSFPLLDDDVNLGYSFEPESAEKDLNDLLLLREYHYTDFEYFTVERLQELMNNRIKADVGAYKDIYREMVYDIYSFPKVLNVEIEPGIHHWLYNIERVLRWNVIWNIVLLIYIVLLLRKRNLSKDKVLCILVLFGGMIVELAAILLLTGHTPRRAALGPRMAAELLSLFVLVNQKRKKKENNVSKSNLGIVTAAVVLVFVGTIRIMNCFSTPSHNETGMVLAELRNYTSEQYVLDGRLLWRERLGILNVRSLNKNNYENFFENMILSGGWLAETPLATRLYKEDGIHDPMTQLAVNPHFHYVLRRNKEADLIPLMMSYLKRQCGYEVIPAYIYVGDDLLIVDFKKDI